MLRFLSLIFLIFCIIKSNANDVENTYYITGLITNETLDEIINSPTRIDRIELHSAGGVLKASYQLAQWIRANGVTTSVRKNAICYSACTLLFQAGTRRIADPTAIFMYHSARYSDVYIQNFLRSHDSNHREDFRQNLAKYFSDVQNENVYFFSELKKYGIHSKLIEILNKQPEESNWLKNGNLLRRKDLYLKPKQLIKFNVITEITDDKMTDSKSEQWIRF